MSVGSESRLAIGILVPTSAYQIFPLRMQSPPVTGVSSSRIGPHHSAERMLMEWYLARKDLVARLGCLDFGSSISHSSSLSKVEEPQVISKNLCPLR